MNYTKTITLILCGLASAALSCSQAAVVAVGDPRQPAELPGAIYKAQAAGAGEIAINPGVYHLPPMNGRPTVSLDHWRETVIHASGATLIFSELNGRPVHFNHCENVTWDGGTLLFVHPTFTQGRVIATGTDAKGEYCDWQIDAGYPADIDPVKSTYDIVDATTRVLKVNTGDWAPQSAEPLAPGRYRLHYPVWRRGGFAVHDWLVTRAPGGNSIFHVDTCRNCTVRNVALENAGFAAFFETGGVGGNHYLHCQIQPGPLPPGASEPQLVGCGADGFHSANTITGPDLEDCEFHGVFLDDCIAIHGTFDRVIASGSDEVRLSSAQEIPQPGDPVRIADMHGFFVQATCVSATREADGKVLVKLDHPVPAPIDHTQDGDPKKGTKFCDINRCGRGYKILRCKLGDTRSRGILVKADDGLIQGCVIRGCGMSGICIGPEFWWNEAGYCWNVTVTENRLTECNKNNGDLAPIWVHGDGAIGNRNILIKNNTLDHCYGQYIIRVGWTDGAQIMANQIFEPFQIKLQGPGSAIWLTNSKHLKLADNKLVNPGPFGNGKIGLGPGIDASEVQNLDAPLP